MKEVTLFNAEMNTLKMNKNHLYRVNEKFNENKVLCVNRTGSESFVADVIGYGTMGGMLYAELKKSEPTV